MQCSEAEFVSVLGTAVWSLFVVVLLCLHAPSVWRASVRPRVLGIVVAACVWRAGRREGAYGAGGRSEKRSSGS